jgi:acyl carrier protein
MSESSTLDRLRTMLVEQFGISADAIKDDVPFTELGMDSLTVVDFIFKAEDAFGVSIDFDRALKHPTLTGFATLVDALRAETGKTT